MIFGFVLAVCFIPAWTGAAIPTGWVFLSCTLPLILWRNARWQDAYLLGLLFLGYVGLSLLWTPVPIQGIGDLWLLGVLAGAFLWGAQGTQATSVYQGLAAGVGVSTALAIPQLYWDWQGVFQFWKPAGLFVNPGVYGETCALLTVVLIASRSYWPALLVAPGIYLSSSRTAALACAAALALAARDKVASMGPARPALWKNPYVLSSALVLALLAGVAVKGTLIREPNWWTSPAERLAIWKDTVDGLTLWGRGAGSFSITYPVFAKRTDTMASRPEHAHSDILEFAYEYGLGALPLAALLVIGLWAPLGPERYLLVAFLTCAALGFPTRTPVAGFLGAFALGRCCRLWHLSRLPSTYGRPYLASWAGAGEPGNA